MQFCRLYTLMTQRQQGAAVSMIQDVHAYAHNTSGRRSTVQHGWLSASFHAHHLFPERWICVLPLFYPCDPPVSLFAIALMLDSQFLCILVIFLSVFCQISAVFIPFLRSASFASPLLLDKSAFYLTANHYHSEGRREAEGKLNGGRTDPRPIHNLMASCRFCKHFCQFDIVLQR